MQPLGDEVWFASLTGVYVVDQRDPRPLQPRRVDTSAHAPQNAQFVSLCSDADQQLWFGHTEGLLRRDRDGALRAVMAQGMPSRFGAWHLHCGASQVYVSTTAEELYALSHDGRHAQRVDLPQRPGISIMAMLEDRRGWLWVSTSQGLLVRAQGRWRLFTQADGLAWDDGNADALVEGPDGAIWVGTSRGLSQIQQPQAALGDAAPLPLRLAELRYGQRELDPARPGALDWTPKPMTVRWAMPTFGDRSALLTRYRLSSEGDASPGDTWSETRLAELQLANLDAGDHRLELIGVDPSHGRQSATVTLSFSIAPPWWRSLPFRLLMLSVAGLAILAAMRWRVRRLVRRQAELEALVQARTHELAASHEEMRRLAMTDVLTGAMNRRAIMEAAQRELSRLQRQPGVVTLVLVDLDFFKRVNDQHGHPAGDALLRGVVQRLQADIRDVDLLGRYGGEEFMLVMPGLSMAEPDGLARVQALCRRVADAPFDIGSGVPLSASCSMGAATSAGGPPQAAGVDPLEALIARADAALYVAKQSGRNRVQVAADEAVANPGAAAPADVPPIAG
jgi:diguanylate cyclase (GGDEF)-like protein